MTELRVDARAAEIRFDDGGLNLLGSGALEELHGLLDQIDGSVEVLTFRSGRPGLFAAGADIAEMEAFDRSEAVRFSRLGQDLMRRIETHDALTIAIVDGDCFGGALDLFMAFEVRVATPRSRFSHPGGKLGIVTGFGGTTRWRRLITPEGGRRLFIENAVLNCPEAASVGIVTHPSESPEKLIEQRLPRWLERWPRVAPLRARAGAV